MATITEMVVKIGADVSDFERNMSRTQGYLQDTFGRMSSIGRNMTAAITTPLVGAGVAAVMTGAKFDTSMSKVAAVTGATGKDFKILRDKAKEMGRTTQFSASESAEAMSYLGMAGFDTKQIMASVGDVMNLAAAGQIDLARAADISSNVLTGFGLKAEDMGRVSDVMAKGAASANTNIEQLGYAMSYAAPIASSMGWSLEESTAAIGMFSNAGIQGEKAGTALRGIIASLSNPTGQTAEKLKQLGLSAEEVNPKTNSLADILKKLEGAGMDSSEAMELVGVEAGPALAALMKQGTGELEKFTTKLENSKGAGKKMAKTMQDNVGGSFKGLMSAVEAVALSFYDQWEPAIRAGTEVLRDLATWISDLSPTTVTLISAIGGMVAIAGPLLWAIGSLGNALPGIVVGFKSVMGAIKIARVAFLAFNTTLFTTPIGWIILGIAAVVAAIVLLWKNWDTVTAFLGECWEAIKGMATAFFEPIAEFISEIWSSIKDATMNIWNGIKDFLAEWGTTLLAILFPGFGLILAMIIENWDAVKAGTVAVWNAIKAFFAPIIQWFVGIVKTSWNAIKAVTVPVWNAIKAVLVAVWNGIKAVVSPIISWFVGIIKSSWNIIKSVTSTVFNAVKSVISTVWNAMKSTIGTTIKGITTVVKDGFRLVRSIIQLDMGGARKIITGYVSKFKSSGKALLDALTKGIRNGLKGAISAVSNGMKKIRSYLPFSPAKEGPLSDLDKSGESFFPTWAGGIRKGQRPMVRQVQAGMNRVVELMDSAPVAGRGSLAVSATGSNRGSTSSIQDQVGSPIIIKEMHIREEADIRRVADELWRMQQRRDRRRIGR